VERVDEEAAGVWVSSVKEFKPRRGPSYLRKRCEGAVLANTLESDS